MNKYLGVNLTKKFKDFYIEKTIDILFQNCEAFGKSTRQWFTDCILRPQEQQHLETS